MSKIWTRDLTEQIIAEFKKHPALYDSGDATYQDKQKRLSSLQEIYVALLEYVPSITIDCIKHKLFSLRSQYRKELRSLVKSSRRSGVHEDEIRPSLWCFKELDFLRAHVRIQEELIRNGISSSEKSSENMNEYVEESFEEYSESLQSMNQYHYKNIIKLERTKNLKRKQLNDSPQMHKNKCRLLPDEDANENEIENEDEDVDEHKNEDDDNDSYNYNDNEYANDEKETMENDPIENTSTVATNVEAYGNCWAAEYSKLNAIQQIYAKRAIDEVLFQGRLGKLTKKSTEIQIDGT